MGDAGSGVSSAVDLVRLLWPEPSRLLDIGCGSGAFVRALTDLGHDASGCDPQAERIAEARARVPEAQFAVAGAEELPFPDGAFDGAVMLRSLHHVPGDRMAASLREARRCIGPRGSLVVVEPVADGSFFELLRIVDDETAVRRQALEALDDACRGGVLERRATHRWSNEVRCASVQEVIDVLLASDPSRAVAIADSRPSLEAAFVRVGRPVDGGRSFLHRTRADVFAG